MNDKIINPEITTLQERNVVNATDLEGASSMIAGLENEGSQIQETQKIENIDKSDEDVLALNKSIDNLKKEI